MYDMFRYLPVGLMALTLIALAMRSQAAETTPGKANVNMQFPLEIKGAEAVRERLRLDLAAVRSALQEAGLAAGERREILDRAQQLAAQIEVLPAELPPDFRTIMPFNDLQAAIFALHAPVLRARGFPALCAWTQNRWDPLFPTSAPESPPETPRLAVALMRGEVRAEAFHLTNATGKPITAHLRLRGLPGGDNPAWVSVREVLFTDTYVHFSIAAALPDAPRAPDGYTVTIPAGMTRQVWLTFHPTDEPVGTHPGEVVVTAEGVEPIPIPFQVRLYPFDFPAEPSLALGGWDYTHQEPSAYDAAHVDQAAFIKFLRDYGVNTPWAAGIPVAGCEFDAEGRLTRPPDFAAWDAWIAKWPGARYYALFLGFGGGFYGEQIGTPRFQRMVGEWITAVVERARGQGIRPGQLLLLLVDEPLKPEQDAVIIPWAEAIRAAQPEVVLWEDPCHDDPRQADPRLYEVCDVLSPSAARFVGSPPSYRDFFVAQQRAGRELWFYSCVNGKHLDPITYHRGQFWLALQYGAKGSCYWAFGDEGGAGSSFRAYTSPGHMFSPLFLDPEWGIIDGKHIQALREGAEDYEYFVMLRQRIADLEARGVHPPALESARRLLTDGPLRVTREITLDRLDWKVPKDRALMDQVRVEVLEMLAALDRL